MSTPLIDCGIKFGNFAKFAEIDQYNKEYLIINKKKEEMSNE